MCGYPCRVVRLRVISLFFIHRRVHGGRCMLACVLAGLGQFSCVRFERVCLLSCLMIAPLHILFSRQKFQRARVMYENSICPTHGLYLSNGDDARYPNRTSKWMLGGVDSVVPIVLSVQYAPILRSPTPTESPLSTAPDLFAEHTLPSSIFKYVKVLTYVQYIRVRILSIIALAVL